MAVDITGAGLTGVHTFAKTNINFDDDYIYFKNDVAENQIPDVFEPGVTFIYSSAAGSLAGVVLAGASAV